MKTHDIKKVMVGLAINEDQTPGIRFEIVMDGIPEELKVKTEELIKDFENKAMDIVKEAHEITSKKKTKTIIE